MKINRKTRKKPSSIDGIISVTHKPNDVGKENPPGQSTDEITDCDSIYAKLKYLRKSVSDVNKMIKHN